MVIDLFLCYCYIHGNDVVGFWVNKVVPCFVWLNSAQIKTLHRNNHAFNAGIMIFFKTEVLDKGSTYSHGFWLGPNAIVTCMVMA
jgi:hypothetical protein